MCGEVYVYVNYICVHCVSRFEVFFNPPSPPNLPKYTYTQTTSFAAAPHHFHPLLKLLLDQNLTFVHCLCSVTPKASVDSISFAIVNIFETSGRAMDLLAFMIDLEFETIHAANTLFRDNSFSSKSLSAYNKIVTRSYLRKTLRPLVYSLYYNNVNVELEETKLGPNETLDENVKNITAVVQVCTNVCVERG